MVKGQGRGYMCSARNHRKIRSWLELPSDWKYQLCPIEWRHNQWHRMTPKGQGNEYLTSNISKSVRNTRLVTIKTYRKTSSGLSNGAIKSDLVWRSKVKAMPICVQIIRKPWATRRWLQKTMHIGDQPSSGRFVKQEQWEHWRANRKFV